MITMPTVNVFMPVTQGSKDTYLAQQMSKDLGKEVWNI